MHKHEAMQIPFHASFAPYFGHEDNESEPLPVYLENVHPEHILDMPDEVFLTFYSVLRQFTCKPTWGDKKGKKEVDAVAYLALLFSERYRRECPADFVTVKPSSSKMTVARTVDTGNGDRFKKADKYIQAFAKIVGAEPEVILPQLATLGPNAKLNPAEIGSIIGASYHKLVDRGEEEMSRAKAFQQLISSVDTHLKDHLSWISRYRQTAGQINVLQRIAEMVFFATRDNKANSAQWDHIHWETKGINVGIVIAGALDFTHNLKASDEFQAKILEYTVDAAVIISLGAAVGAMGPSGPVGLVIAAPIASGLVPLVGDKAAKKVLPVRYWAQVVTIAKKQIEAALGGDQLIIGHSRHFEDGMRDSFDHRHRG